MELSGTSRIRVEFRLSSFFEAKSTGKYPKNLQETPITVSARPACLVSSGNRNICWERDDTRAPHGRPPSGSACGKRRSAHSRGLLLGARSSLCRDRKSKAPRLLSDGSLC